MEADRAQELQYCSLRRSPVSPIRNNSAQKNHKYISVEVLKAASVMLLGVFAPVGKAGLDQVQREERKKEIARRFLNEMSHPSSKIDVKIGVV
jgi:precorrin-6x reductase